MINTGNLNITLCKKEGFAIIVKRLLECMKYFIL